jgi:O-antigen/teichoic acid export membrane protein
MVVLIVANWINVGFGSVGLVLLMAGREKEVLKQQSISIALLVVALIPLTVWFGIIGSSVAVLMSTFYWNFRLSLSLRRFFSRPDGEM